LARAFSTVSPSNRGHFKVISACTSCPFADNPFGCFAVGPAIKMSFISKPSSVGAASNMNGWPG
jgi:hypothetical protein